MISRIALATLIVALHAPFASWAQEPMSDADREALSAKGRELKAQRNALDARYRGELKQCYQEFNVTACRNEAREKYAVDHRELSKREQAQAAQERRVSADDARRRLAQRQNESADREREAQRAQQESIDRAQRNADKQNDHAPEASKRSQFDEKQRDAQQRREEIQRRERERDKPRAAPLPAVGR